MKTLTSLCSIAALILTHSTIYADGFYKWIDAKGNTQYGDKPPTNSNAKNINLPKIMIIDNYAEQWKPLDIDQPVVVNKRIQPKAPILSAISPYTKLAFLAPKPNQAIRANDGDVSAMISIKPPLKKGHKIVFTIDGKPMGKSTSRTKNFKNLPRGQHTVTTTIVDARGKSLKSSSVKFNVLRVNALDKKQPNQVTKLPKARSFKSARQSQIQVSTQDAQTPNR